MLNDRWLMLPTNWDPDLLRRAAPLKPAYLYGSLPTESTLRSPLQLPAATEEVVADYVEAAAQAGIKFIYVMNGTSTDNREQSEDGRWEILQRCQWLSDIGAAGVVAANPLVIEMIRHAYPELEVHVSVLAEVDSPNTARFYEDLGVTVIHLSPPVNRQIPRLAAIRKAVSCQLSVLANEGCLIECPMRRYHAAVLSQSVESVRRGYHVDYCYYRCSLQKIMDPAHYLRMPWIRPEDLGVYEAVGIDLVKVAGREKMGDGGPSSHTDWIVAVAEAYHNKRSDDIAALLVGVETVEPLFGKGERRDIRIKIDSTKLAGFVDFFQKGLCNMDCRTCRFCDEWATRAVTVKGDSAGYQRQLTETIERIRIGDYVTGRPE
jgi:collagenase-like PrtC family protease